MTYHYPRIDYRKPENWTGQLKAIRAKCVDCCGGYKGLVRECHIYTCSLWPFRFGVRPETAGKRLYDFPDLHVFEIEDPEQATEYAGKVPAL